MPVATRPLAGSDARKRSAPAHSPIRVALLGCGTVGSSFAHLVQQPSRGREVVITHALVRDRRQLRPSLNSAADVIDEWHTLFDAEPDVVVELLGGLEPARTIVRAALQRGIAVVTANKSLLAVHGAELRSIAAKTATPLLFEAAVMAGVPFLGTFARRPHASAITGLGGIVNGTSNYLLTRARDERCGILEALADAQALGFAEPDPSKDLDGIDAAEKLVVLLQQFGGFDVALSELETEGITRVTPDDLARARTLGGTIKPVIHADWSHDLHAFAAPAFVADTDLLASVDGVENALSVRGTRGRVVFRGPGAGADVTAATVLDDVLEASRPAAQSTFTPLRSARVAAPDTPWFIQLSAGRLPEPVEIADLLASHGVFVQRSTVDGAGSRFSAITLTCTRRRIEAAMRACRAAAGCQTVLFRAVEGSRHGR